MNFAKIKYFFLDLFVMAAKNWQIVVPILLGIVILIVVAMTVDSCRTQNTEKKKEQINANVLIEKIEVNALTNQKVNSNGDIKNANKVSADALGNFNNSLNRDSGTYSGNVDEAFCRRFPDDLSCQ